MNQYEADQAWDALVERLRGLWGEQFDQKALAARKILDRGGPSLVAQLAGLPLSVQTTIAEGFAKSGGGQGMAPEDAIFAAQMLSSQGSWREYSLQESQQTFT